MNPYIQKFLISNLTIVLLYMVYYLFFRKDTFLQAKRFYLSFGLLFAFVLPFINVSNWIQPSPRLMQVFSTSEVLIPEVIVTPTMMESTSSVSLLTIFILIYAFVSIVFLVRIVIGFFRLKQIRTQAKLTKINNRHVIELKENLAPFSFLKWIFVNPTLHAKEELEQILLHEEIHVRQKHSFDIMLAELATLLFWINPFVWLIRQEIKTNLEYIADSEVLNSGVNAKQYQYHLLNLTCHSAPINLINPFNFTPIKKRIIMMNKKKTSKKWAVKYVLTLPLIAVLVVGVNFNAISSNMQTKLEPLEIIEIPSAEKQVATEDVKKEPAIQIRKVANVKKDEVKASQSDDGRLVYDLVETAPTFPGGEEALFKFVSETTKYPAKALAQNIQGRVIVQFIINEDGSVDEDVKIVRGVDELLDKEAIRVVKLMPKWTAGKLDGKEVRVRYQLPFTFKLDDEKVKKVDDNEDVSTLNKAVGFTKALIVVDGKPQDSDFNLNSVPVESIETITVLKDKSAIEVYGERGRNGVILITTKAGYKLDEMQVTGKKKE